MGNNKRIFYAVESIGFAPDGTSAFIMAHGVQSAGITTNLNLDQIFELGQISIYENKENLPDITFTAQKVLDGYCPLYLLGTQGSSTASLAGRSRVKVLGGYATYDDTQNSASGIPLQETIMSGLFVNSVAYTFNVDGPFTEDVTLVGNNKILKNSDQNGGTTIPVMSGSFLNNDTPRAITGSGGVNIRQNLVFDFPNGNYAFDVNSQLTSTVASILPKDIDGISSSGTNNKRSDGTYQAHLQNITASVDLNRQNILELGRKTPYFKYVQFPVQVTSSFTIIGVKWDNVTAIENGQFANGTNVTENTIRLRTQEGLLVDLGTHNKLTSADINGGDVGGANVSITYNYVTFSDFTVTHWNDATTSLAI